MSSYFEKLKIPAYLTVYWWLTLLVLLFQETRWGFGWWPWPLVTAALLFIVGEATGVARKQRGDTFSEFVRKLYEGKMFRIPLIVGITGYIALAVWTGLLGGETWQAWKPWRVGVLAGGIGAWLAPHFLSDGRHG